MKVRLTLLFSTIISISSIAQISFGVKGGVSLSDIRYEMLPSSLSTFLETKTSAGFYLGMFSEFRLSNTISIIPEIQFSQRGYKLAYDGSNLTINYLELPVLLSFSVKKLGIDIGPNVSYRVSSTADIYKNFDFGLNGGLRLNLTNKLFVTGRYYYGISTIAEIDLRDQNNVPLGTVIFHNSSIQIGIGYKIK